MNQIPHTIYRKSECEETPALSEGRASNAHATVYEMVHESQKVCHIRASSSRSGSVCGPSGCACKFQCYDRGRSNIRSTSSSPAPSSAPRLKTAPVSECGDPDA